MKFKIIYALSLITLLFSPASFAANQVRSVSGGHPQICGGSDELLGAYAKAADRLRELQAQANPDPEAIARYEMVMEMVAEWLDVNQYGMTVIVNVDGPKTIDPNLPTVAVSGESHALAQVTSDGLANELNQIVIESSSAQVTIKFQLLGICAFANAQDGSIGDAEIQAAVDSILGQ